MKVKTAIKTVGLSFAGYALASIFADKATLNPLATQVAGFVGAFLGTLATPRRERAAEAESAGETETDVAPEGQSGAAAPPAAANGARHAAHSDSATTLKQ